MIKPSVMAVSQARKRSRAQGRAVSPDAKRAPINLMDVLKAMDTLYKRLELLEKEVYGKRNY